MAKSEFSKFEAIDYIWQYSKYHGNLLSECEQIAEEEYGHGSLVLLFNLIEVILKNKLGDYESNFFTTIKNAKDQRLINEIESQFLNNKVNGIRKFRNILAHENLSKYNVVINHEELLYPLTENTTCLKLYEIFSEIIFNIILKIIAVDFTITIKPNVDLKIKKIDIKIVQLSAEQLLKFKGFNENHIDTMKEAIEEVIQLTNKSDQMEEAELYKLTENQLYRMGENASDINMLTHIFSNVKMAKSIK